MSATEHTPISPAETDSAQVSTAMDQPGETSVEQAVASTQQSAAVAMESASLSAVDVDAEGSAGSSCVTATADAVPLPPASPEQSSTAPRPEDAHAALSEPSSTASPVETATNGQNRRGRPFERGESGNPNGRPKGSRNRITAALEELIEARGEALVEKAFEKALQGDSPMLRVLLNRVVPRSRDRTVEFAIPEIKTAADAHSASSAIIAACSRGELSPSEASDVMSLISMHVNTIKAVEFEQRLCALEGKKIHERVEA
jgi:hypothetical protein